MQHGQRYHNHRPIDTNTPPFAQIHIHEGNYRRTITVERLTWLWKRYLTTITTNTLTLSSPTQDFATKILLIFKLIGLAYSHNWARIDLTNIALAPKTLKWAQLVPQTYLNYATILIINPWWLDEQRMMIDVTPIIAIPSQYNIYHPWNSPTATIKTIKWIKWNHYSPPY